MSAFQHRPRPEPVSPLDERRLRAPTASVGVRPPSANPFRSDAGRILDALAGGQEAVDDGFGEWDPDPDRRR
jgi:hypothetical protein